MDKLLRSTNIDTIYLLIRSKKGKDVHTRLEDIFDDPVIIKKIKQLIMNIKNKKKFNSSSSKN